VLCEAIIVMAHKLGIKVIAEGIETMEQRDLLTLVGCDYGQGNLFSKAVPAKGFENGISRTGRSIGCVVEDQEQQWARRQRSRPFEQSVVV